MSTLSHNQDRDQHVDYSFLIAVGALLLFGIFMLSSASAIIGFNRYGDAYYFVKRQILLGFIPGAVAFWFFSKFDYRKLEKLALPMFAGSFALLVLVLIPGLGRSAGGARRWLDAGPISFQPSEVVKLCLIIYLAAWLSKRDRSLTDFRSVFVPFCLILGSVLGLIILQPDIGTMSVIAITGTALFFLAGGSLRHIGMMLLGGAAALLVLIKLEPYRAARLTIFLNPEHDPQGIGYHINQALLAIGSGGIWGVGFGQSRAKFQYLPEVFGDSIFAVIAEELGFVFTLVLMALFVFLVLRGLKIALATKDEFGKLLVGGIIVWLGGQALINVAAMVSLVPLTGIPLPLVSYGGTALAVMLGALGIVENIASQQRQ